MLEQFVLQEIMELNTELCLMSIKCEDNRLNNLEQEISVGVDLSLSTVDCNNTSTVSNGINTKDNPGVANEKKIIIPRRSQRKRIRPLDDSSQYEELSKIPKLSDENTDIENYYLCKKFKRLPSTLETIYEEPKELSNKEMFSTRKFKRIIKFEENNSAAVASKIKKRSNRIKKLTFSKKFLNRKKVTMNKLIKTLSNVDSD